MDNDARRCCTASCRGFQSIYETGHSLAHERVTPRSSASTFVHDGAEEVMEERYAKDSANNAKQTPKLPSKVRTCKP